MTLPSFIFGGDTGVKTPEELARARAIADALMQNQTPHNLGEGLYVGLRGIRGRIANAGLDKAEKDMRAGGNSVFSALFGGGTAAPASSSPAAGSEAVASALAGGSIGSSPDLSKNDIYNGFMDTVKTKITNPYGLAAVAATGNAESSFSPKRAIGSWSDPSESGQAGTAGGILSWRGPRFDAMRAFAGRNGGDATAPSPQLQAQYFLQEDPGLVDALNAAKSPEEAQRLMNNAWRFAGYDRPGGEAARRIASANSFASRFAGSNADPVQVASIEPSSGVAAALNAKAGPVPSPASPAVASPVAAALAGQRVQSPRAADGGGSPTATASPAPGTIRRGPDGKTYQYVETTGMAGASGDFGWVPVNSAAESAQRGDVRVAGGPSIEQLMQAAQDPRLSEQQRGLVNMMLQQRMQEADPLRQLQIQKAQRDLDAQPKQWQKLDDNTLFDPTTGETRSVGGGGSGDVFDGKSVEGQSLNWLVKNGKLTMEQAAQIGAGKTITDPSTGAIIFMTPQGVFGQAPGAPAPQPLTPPPAAASAPPAGAPAPSAPSEAPAAPAQPSAPVSPAPAAPAPTRQGMIPLTGAKTKPPNEQQQRDAKLYSVVAPEMQIIEKNFNALSNLSDQALSAIPHGAEYGAEYLKSPDYQRASNSLRTIIASYLYSVSGATAAPAEVENQAAILTPKPGEAQASLDDKLARIRAMVDAIKNSRGEAPAAPAGNAGTTSNGLKWSIEP
jgi:hypothetical protein